MRAKATKKKVQDPVDDNEWLEWRCEKCKCSIHLLKDRLPNAQKIVDDYKKKHPCNQKGKKNARTEPCSKTKE